MPSSDHGGSADRATERLAAYFDEFYTFLVSNGVPPDRLPSPWHVLSRVVRCVDPDLIQGWLEAYVEIEGDPDDFDEREPPAEPAARPRHRPPYLRALQKEIPEGGAP